MSQTLTKEQLASYIDHTLLKPEATAAQIEKICAEALQYRFASVCVNSCHVPAVAKLLSGSPVKACTVVGFPLGACSTKAKAEETKEAVRMGAQEIDMVINIGALKAGDTEGLEQDIRAVREACGQGENRALLKVIIETCLLTDEEKVKACEAAKAAGADFVKTSTGFSTGGATAEDVALMRRTVGNEMGVKASGGIRTLADALKMIEAGASRIGASAGISIIEAL